MKKLIFILIVSVFVCICMSTTDFLLARNNKKPVFAIPIVKYKDGGSAEFFGIGYKVNVYVFNDIYKMGLVEDVDFGSWFMKFEK